MKIAMISEHASPLDAADRPGGTDGGGQHVQVAELARELGRQEHHVTVYTRRDGPELRERVRFAPGVTVEHVTAGPTRPLPKDELLPYMAEFGTHLAGRWGRDRPDVVHAHHWMSGLAALAGARPLGPDPQVPVVQSYHSLGLITRRHHGLKDTSPSARIRLEKAIGHTADRVIASCADEAAELLRMGVPRPHIGTVPCGVDVERFTPEGPARPRSEAPRLLVLSRLTEHKGVGTAIRALVRIPRAELVIAGGPPREELPDDPGVRRLRQVAEASGVTDRVTFLGRMSRHDVPSLLRSADLVLSLPEYETFGLVPLEAMACGIPVVATEVGGHLDSVVDNVTGLHVPPGRPVELARQVRRLLADPTRRHALGIAGADRARARYRWERIAQETAKVYEQVMAPGSVPAELFR